MLNIGKCKCDKEFKVDDTYYDHNNFEGHIRCLNCLRLYYYEIKRGKVRLGRCFRFMKDPIPLLGRFINI